MNYGRAARTEPDWVTFHRIPEALDLLRISKSHLYAEIRAGRLKLHYIGASSRIRSDELQAYIQSRPTSGGKRGRPGQ